MGLDLVAVIVQLSKKLTGDRHSRVKELNSWWWCMGLEIQYGVVDIGEYICKLGKGSRKNIKLMDLILFSFPLLDTTRQSNCEIK